MKYFKEKLCGVISSAHLDRYYPYYSNDEVNEVEGPDKESWLKFKAPVPEIKSYDIDDAINNLEMLKQMGSERVYIVADSNHGYFFSGVTLEGSAIKYHETYEDYKGFYHGWRIFKLGETVKIKGESLVIRSIFSIDDRYYFSPIANAKVGFPVSEHHGYHLKEE